MHDTIMDPCPISHLGERTGETISGQYVMTQLVSRTSQLGDPYHAIRLTDYSGNLQAYGWANAGLAGHIPLRLPAAVSARLRVRRLHGEVIANLCSIRELAPQEVGNAAAMLPHDRCPPRARVALGRLVDFVQHLEPEPLRGFMNQVFLDPQIACEFITCKGSQRHHHSEPGGLLVHSIEVMDIATGMAGRRLDALELAITEVAAVLHDLGKLRAVGSGSVRPIHHLLASHEIQTLRMLDPHIEWLRARAPDIAAGLDYTLGFLAQPAPLRGQAKFLAGDLVVAADRMSAALDNHRHLDNLLDKTMSVGHGRMQPDHVSGIKHAR